MENNNFSKMKLLKIIGFAVVVIIVILLFAINYKKITKTTKDKSFLIQSAPNSVLYPTFPKITIDGKELTRTENGIETKIDGKDVLIKDNGKVYVKDENGNWVRADEEINKKALDLVEKASKEDSNFTISNLPKKEKTLTQMTDEELEQYAKENNLDLKDLKEKVRSAKEKGKEVSKKEINKKNDIDKAIEEMIENLGLDLSKDEIKKIIEEKYEGNAEKFFEDVLKKGSDNFFNEKKEEVKTKNEEKEQRYGNEKFTYDDYLAGITDSLDGITNPPTSYEKQNNQSGKKDFVAKNQKGTKIISYSKKNNMITKGTIINATLITTINTDLPGSCYALVNQNVLDSFTMENIIVPKGSRLVGTYDSSVSYGQTRVLVAWNEIIRPDGLIIQLNGYGTFDKGGSGINGSVNNHIGDIVGATALMSLINYADSKINSLTNIEILNKLLTGTSESVVNVEEKIIDKQLDKQPTIRINGGVNISIVANDNIELPIFAEW